jgi:hypothetical protein
MRSLRQILPAAAAVTLAAAVVTLAAAAAPAAAAGATWGDARDATRAGSAAQPSVAMGGDTGFAVGFIRTLGEDEGAVHRAEVRAGKGDGLRGPSVVLDTSTTDLAALTVTLAEDDDGSDLLAAAWLRHADRAKGPRAATVTGAGDVHGPVDLVPDGTESASNPRWHVGRAGRAGRLLTWDRRTTSGAAALEGTRFAPPIALPGAGAPSSLDIAEDVRGDAVAVWLRAGQVLAAQAQGDGAFGAPTVLSGPGVAREPRVIATPDGATYAAWLRNTGTGNVLEVATRGPRGAFGAATAVSDPLEGAFAPQLVRFGGGVAAVWTVGTRERGWGSQRGPLRMQVLDDDGTPAGAPVTITPPGVRIAAASIASEGDRGLFAGWTVGPERDRRVVVRRVAANGVLGRPRTLAAGRMEDPPAPVLAANDGRAVAAWTDHGTIRYRLYG